MMTQFLKTDEKPDGYRLEEILSVIRKDIVKRAEKIIDDERLEAKQVLENNIKILGLITECIKTAEDSTRILDKAFGPHQVGQPRIGVA